MVEFPLTELRTLQASIGAANAAKGFHDEGDALRHQVASPFVGESDMSGEVARYDATNLRNYYANKLLLVVSEVVEAHDELRKGRAVDDTYYSSPSHDYMDANEADAYLVEHGFPAKPEGFLSEASDVVIRMFDLCDEAGLDLAAMIEEKLEFNATRNHMHGKKF